MSTEANPRATIRSYIIGLFEQLGEDLQEQWPNISHQEFSSLRHRLRQRFEQIYEFVDQQKDLSRQQKFVLKVTVESTLQLLYIDWLHPKEYHQASEQTYQQLDGRPISTMHFDQLYCTPDSTERRIQQLQEDLDVSQANVLFLGDDDLGSVLLAPFCDGEIRVMDIDERLFEFIHKRAENIQTQKTDLIKGGLDPSMAKRFDAVVLDPPWEYHKTWSFLDKAIYCLKQDPNARIYLSYCPLNLEFGDKKMHHFFKRLSKLGMVIERMTPCFNLYSLDPDYAGEFPILLQQFLPRLDSPLIEYLRKLPFGYSNLYTLRRIKDYKLHPITQKIFSWWNQAQ